MKASEFDRHSLPAGCALQTENTTDEITTQEPQHTRRIKCEATWQCLPHTAQRSQLEYLSKRSDKGWGTERFVTNQWAGDKLSAVYTGLRAEMCRLSDSIRSTAASSVASTIPVAHALTALISNLRRFIVGSRLTRGSWCVVPGLVNTSDLLSYGTGLSILCGGGNRWANPPRDSCTLVMITQQGKVINTDLSNPWNHSFRINFQCSFRSCAHYG